MKTMIALDIDNVLLPWDDDSYAARLGDKRYDRWGKLTGFKDWELRDRKFFTFTSSEQHALIEQVGDVHWLTTWVKHDMIPYWAEVTGWGADFRQVKPEQSYEADYLYRWWKMGWLWTWVRENHEHVASYDRILWVDDDHYPHLQEGLADVAFECAQLGTELIVVQPEAPVWSREEITQWLSEA